MNLVLGGLSYKTRENARKKTFNKVLKSITLNNLHNLNCNQHQTWFIKDDMNDETPIRDLPRFVALTQINGRPTYIRSDLIDLSVSKDEDFGTRLCLKTSKHPMVAFNGFLDVKERREEIERLMSFAPATLKYLSVTDVMDLGTDKSIKADQVDIVVVANTTSSSPIINVFSNEGRLFSQTFINPITDSRNLPEKSAILRIVRQDSTGPSFNL